MYFSKCKKINYILRVLKCVKKFILFNKNIKFVKQNYLSWQPKRKK